MGVTLLRLMCESLSIDGLGDWMYVRRRTPICRYWPCETDNQNVVETILGIDTEAYPIFTEIYATYEVNSLQPAVLIYILRLMQSMSCPQPVFGARVQT